MLEIELPRSRDAARIARRWIADSFAADLSQEELERAKLLGSELVTNAVVHGQGKITARGELDEDRLLVEVIDEGSGFERVIRHVEFDELGGRGLAIVEAEASRWGIHEGTTHVWFELERPGPRVGAEGKPV